MPSPNRAENIEAAGLESSPASDQSSQIASGGPTSSIYRHEVECGGLSNPRHALSPTKQKARFRRTSLEVFGSEP